MRTCFFYQVSVSAKQNDIVNQVDRRRRDIRHADNLDPQLLGVGFEPAGKRLGDVAHQQTGRMADRVETGADGIRLVPAGADDPKDVFG